MTFFDPTRKVPGRGTPNWRQTLWLLLGAFLLAVGSCAGAFAVFSAGYGNTTSKVLVAIWWALMAVFCASVLAFLVGIVFLLIMAVRALVRGSGNGGAERT